MENTYGIGVRNRYELFYDEDVDPLEIIRETQEAKEKRKTDKTQTKDKSKSLKPAKPSPTAIVSKKPKENLPSTAPPKPVETTEIASKPRTRPFADRNIKGPRNVDDSRETDERKHFRNREDAPHQSSEPRERDGEMRRGRGAGFRGRGRPRGRGNYFDADNRPPRRDFERHNAGDKSGVRERKDSFGSNNWSDVRTDFGSRKREPDSTWDEEFESSSADKVVTDSNWDNTANETPFIPSPVKEESTPIEKSEETNENNNESKENVEGGEEEVQQKEMTLDEWKREQEAKRVVPKYNLRKPGEGEDGNQWKKLYVLKKKAKENGEEEDEEEEEEDVDDDEFARRGRQRQLIDIQINFNDSRRGRGRGRGGRGAGGPRSGTFGNKEVHREERREPLPGSSSSVRNYRSMKMKSSQPPRVDDWNDFPSLVTA